MSEKSQKTEEEMLDQTFGTYDAEMTAEPDAETVNTTTSKTVTTAKKPMNSNVIIAGGVGLAAIAFLGYKFMAAPAQPQQQQQVQQVQPLTPVAPVVQQTAVAPVVATTTTETTVQPQADTSAAAQYLSNSNPLAPKADKVETAAVVAPQPEAPKTEVKVDEPKVEPVKTVVKTEVQTQQPKVDVTLNPNVVASNAAQSGLTSELKSLFDKQTQEIKGAVENVGNRVDKLEQTVAKQESTNKSIESRLQNLENGKVVKVVKTTVTEDSDVKPVKHVVKHNRKPVVVRHRHITTKVAKEPKQESSVLIDKSVNSTVLVNDKVDSGYQNIEIHSVYGGRVWTKNKDGSLSTYAVGERLPSGEIIKKIDDDKFKVITDKRTISK